MKRTLTPLMVFGIVWLAVVAVSWLFFEGWRNNPNGIWTLLGLSSVGVLAFLKGGIDYLNAYKELTKPNNREDNPTTPNHQMGNVTQSGGGTQVVVQGGNVIIQESPPPGQDTHDTIGFIPPVRAWKYIRRGKIEDDVIAFLKSGGIGAIVGVHAPGGLGKTELAKHAWEAVRNEFEDILWVNVGENTPEQVIADMLLQCGIRTEPTATYAERRNELRAYLKTRRLLVVLDDMRQSAAGKIDDLLPPKPCACLVTSRIQQIGGVTRTFELDPMTPAQVRELMEAALGAEAVSAESEAAAKLAERCRFNPLALEIASRRILQDRGAARIANYLKKVETRFAELKMAGDKRWDMTAVFDISYNDLSPADRQRFRRLAAFHPTGFSPEAAARVWGEDVTEADLALSRLVNLSLVMKLETDADRYRLHDLLDEYAAPLFAQSGEEESARQALAEWLVELFEKHYTDDPSTARHVAAEKENLFLSANWAEKAKHAHLLALLATKPRNWLSVIFNVPLQWRHWLSTALDLKLDDELRLKADCIQALGDVHTRLSELPEARTRYEEALPIYRTIGDKLGEANTLSSLMLLDLTQYRDVDEAEKRLGQVVALRRLAHHRYGEGADYGNYAFKLLEIGDKQRAKLNAEKARRIFLQIGLPKIVEMMDDLISKCE